MKSRQLYLTTVLAVGLLPWLAGNGNAEQPPREWTLSGATGPQRMNKSLLSIAKGKATLGDNRGADRAVSLKDLPEEQRKAALIQVVGSGVVVIHVQDIFNEPSGVGSGFVFRKDGLILTNYHVVRGAGAIEVQFRDGKSRLKAECLAVDCNHDVAVLKVERLPEGTHILELAPQAAPQQGDPVWTIGHPNQLTNTISWGDVNAVRRTAELPECHRANQM
jgi:S1-C subfamily serine protease